MQPFDFAGQYYLYYLFIIKNVIFELFVIYLDIIQTYKNVCISNNNDKGATIRYPGGGGLKFLSWANYLF